MTVKVDWNLGAGTVRRKMGAVEIKNSRAFL
jgi:hypothetical protein